MTTARGFPVEERGTAAAAPPLSRGGPFQQPSARPHLLVDGGGLDGGECIYFANAADDMHAVGSLQPLAPVVGCIVIRPDGSRHLARVVPDPLAQQPD